MQINDMLNRVYEALDGNDMAEDYFARHEIQSAAILTVTDDERAHLIADYLADRVRGKTVVEIGAGIGLLSLHLSGIASRVYAIEANPAWTWVFLGVLFSKKPKNVSWLFGAADEFFGGIHADVAIFCTHSDHEGMRKVAAMFAPVVIDVYDELVGDKREQLLSSLTTDG
jgi:hypothetical protein